MEINVEIGDYHVVFILLVRNTSSIGGLEIKRASNLIQDLLKKDVASVRECHTVSKGGLKPRPTGIKMSRLRLVA